MRDVKLEPLRVLLAPSCLPEEAIKTTPHPGLPTPDLLGKEAVKAAQLSADPLRRHAEQARLSMPCVMGPPAENCLAIACILLCAQLRISNESRPSGISLGLLASQGAGMPIQVDVYVPEGVQPGRQIGHTQSSDPSPTSISCWCHGFHMIPRRNCRAARGIGMFKRPGTPMPRLREGSDIWLRQRLTPLGR